MVVPLIQTIKMKDGVPQKLTVMETMWLDRASMGIAVIHAQNIHHLRSEVIRICTRVFIRKCRPSTLMLNNNRIWSRLQIELRYVFRMHRTLYVRIYTSMWKQW